MPFMIDDIQGPLHPIPLLANNQPQAQNPFISPPGDTSFWHTLLRNVSSPPNHWPVGRYWQLGVLGSPRYDQCARALQLVSHIDGSVQGNLLMPRARDSYANINACASVFIFWSIAPELLLQPHELGLKGNASASKLMMWLHSMASTRQPDLTDHEDPAKFMRIGHKDHISMDAYDQEALNLWARITHCCPSSAILLAATSIL
ncbi:hypothetical protein H0G86_011247 [Trichoderma simmonsii]|uniref:Uncharacterized protein n=1 Tax=Trichoderma simmonsii TaxID=1491479 RepID=A0A8G0LL60_9HYPO|nr:hypothetical protein H0G86_011247 [Trichoderma simmonsii]